MTFDNTPCPKDDFVAKKIAAKIANNYLAKKKIKIIKDNARTCPICNINPETIETYYGLCDACEILVDNSGNRKNAILEAAKNIKSARIDRDNMRYESAIIKFQNATTLLFGSTLNK